MTVEDSPLQSRRTFLSRGLYGAAGFALTGCALSSGEPLPAPLRAERLTGRVRALVIGSGFGGAVAALRLGEAGVETTVLERGQAWPLEGDATFPTVIVPDRRAAWFSATTTLSESIQQPLGTPYAGLVERVASDGIEVTVAACVGGGSLLYAGALIQPTRALFERVFPADVDYGEMDAIYYPKVRELLRPSPLPADILTRDPYAGARLFIAQARAAGFEARAIDSGFDWDLVRAELAGDKPASAIIGEYTYGTNSGAKLGLDRSYLRAAVETGNVEILPLHVVTDIREAASGYEVSCQRIDAEGTVLEQRVVQADYLFVCAGSVHSSKLFVRAKARGGLARLNESVGVGWGNNGDMVATSVALAPTGAPQGGPSAYAYEDHDNPLAPVMVMHAPSPFPLELHNQLQLCMSIPDALGQFRYDAASDEVTLHFPIEADLRAREAMQATLQRLGSGLLAVPRSSTRSTYHPLGGMPLGKACDSFGRVLGYERLYVVDGALIPNGSTACANPALTIAALAERCMERILSEDFG